MNYEIENSRQILNSLESQLSHRLEKLWRVFSWSSSILVSIIAGTITLRKIYKSDFTLAEFCIISAVIIIFTTYAFLMIKENLKFEGKIRDQLEKLMAEEIKYPPFKELRPDKAVFGYKLVILLLGIAALFTVWVEYFTKVTLS